MASSEEISVIGDQAITIFTWVTFGVVCQIINLFGIVSNIINIICFVKQGFKDSVNISLLGLALSDLGSLITMVCICLTPAMCTADLQFDVMEIGYLTSGMPHFAFTRVSGCITAMITLERCLCIIAPLKIKRIITPRRTAAITVCAFIIFVFSGSPVYVVNSLGVKFSVSRNKTIYGMVSTENRENVEMISFVINNFVVPFSAFMIIVACTTILSFKLRSSTRWRQKTITSSQVDRVSSRNKKAATMVVMISSLYIVCFVPVSVIMLAFAFLPSLSVNGKYMNVSVIIFGIGDIMESINSSMNIFIYYHMSSKYKDTLRRLFLGLVKLNPHVT